LGQSSSASRFTAGGIDAAAGKSPAKSSFLAPKLRLNARLLLKRVARCLAVLAVVLRAIA